MDASVKEKSKLPVLLHQAPMGENWSIFWFLSPDKRTLCQLSVHKSKLKSIVVDEKTKEIDMPPDVAYSLKEAPEGFFAPNFRAGGLYEDK